MQIQLMFRPTRTREYSGTLHDFVNDLLVPRAVLEAVCLNDGAQLQAGQRLIEELRAAAPVAAIQYRLTMEYGVYHDQLKKHLQDAIRVDRCELHGLASDSQLPTAVHVVLMHEQYRAWGGEIYTQLWGRAVHATAEQAEAQLRPGYDYTVVEMPLLGVPAMAG